MRKVIINFYDSLRFDLSVDDCALCHNIVWTIVVCDKRQQRIGLFSSYKTLHAWCIKNTESYYARFGISVDDDITTKDAKLLIYGNIRFGGGLMMCLIEFG